MKTISDEQVVEWACKRIGWNLVPNSGPRFDHVAIRTPENYPVCYLYAAPSSLVPLTRIMDAVFPNWTCELDSDARGGPEILVHTWDEHEPQAAYVLVNNGDYINARCRAILDVLRKYMEACDE